MGWARAGEPAAFFRTSAYAPFHRLVSTPYSYCPTRLDGVGSQTDTTPLGAQACDFPFQTVEKGHSRRVGHLLDVSELVDRLELSYEDMMAILTANGDYYNVTGFFTSACALLRARPDIVNSVQPRHAPLPLVYPLIFLALVILVTFAREAVSSVIARTRKATEQATLRVRLSALSLASALNGSNRVVTTAGAPGDTTGQPTPFVPLAPPATSAKLTLMRATYVVAEAEESVTLPVLRVDEGAGGKGAAAAGGTTTTTLRCKATVLSFTATHGRDFGDMRVAYFDEDCAATAVPDADTGGPTECELVFHAGVAGALISIPIRRVHGYSATRFFLVRLEPMEGVACHLSQAIVRVLNDETFPNGVVLPRSAVTTSLATWTVVYHFLREAHRGKWSTALKYQLVHVVNAGISGIAQPVLYGYMLSSFAGQKRLNVSFFSAILSFACWVLQSYEFIKYESGAYTVRQQLQRWLTRKYLSLSDEDIGHLPDIRERCRQAIQTTAVHVAKQCYGGFHNCLKSVWNLLFAIVYLFASEAQAFNLDGFRSSVDSLTSTLYGVGIPSSLLILILVGLVRSPRGARLLREWTAKDVRLQEKLQLVLGSRGLIRSAKREGQVTLDLEDAINQSLGANFKVWMHDNASKSMALTVIALIQYRYE